MTIKTTLTVTYSSEWSDAHTRVLNSIAETLDDEVDINSITISMDDNNEDIIMRVTATMRD